MNIETIKKAIDRLEDLEVLLSDELKDLFEDDIDFIVREISQYIEKPDKEMIIQALVKTVKEIADDRWCDDCTHYNNGKCDRYRDYKCSDDDYEISDKSARDYAEIIYRKARGEL